MSENYATSWPWPHGTAEIICLNCDTKFYTAGVLGPDNVWRQLPASCRNCNNVGKIEPAQERDRTCE